MFYVISAATKIYDPADAGLLGTILHQPSSGKTTTNSLHAKPLCEPYMALSTGRLSAESLLEASVCWSI